MISDTSARASTATTAAVERSKMRCAVDTNLSSRIHYDKKHSAAQQQIEHARMKNALLCLCNSSGAA
jgi:hypothetical protein